MNVEQIIDKVKELTDKRSQQMTSYFNDRENYDASFDFFAELRKFLNEQPTAVKSASVVDKKSMRYNVMQYGHLQERIYEYAIKNNNKVDYETIKERDKLLESILREYTTPVDVNKSLKDFREIVMKKHALQTKGDSEYFHGKDMTFKRVIAEINEQLKKAVVGFVAPVEKALTEDRISNALLALSKGEATIGIAYADIMSCLEGSREAVIDECISEIDKRLSLGGAQSSSMGFIREGLGMGKSLLEQLKKPLSTQDTQKKKNL